MPMKGTVLRAGEAASYHAAAEAAGVSAPPELPPIAAEEILWKEAEARGLIPSVCPARPMPAYALDFDAVNPARPVERPQLPANLESALLQTLRLHPQPLLVRGTGAAACAASLFPAPPMGISPPAERVLIVNGAGDSPPEAFTEPVLAYRRTQLAEETRHRELSGRWAELLEETERLNELDVQLRKGNCSDEEIRETTRREWNAPAPDGAEPPPEPIRRRMRDALAEIAVREAENGAERDRQTANLSAYRETLDLLKPLAEARLHLRWWTTRFWRSLFRKGLMGRWRSLQADSAAAENRLTALGEEAVRLKREAEKVREGVDADLEALLQDHVAGRCRQRDDFCADLGRRREDLIRALDACWNPLREAWPELPERPGTIDAVRFHQGRHREHYDQFLHESRWAEQWLKRFAELPPLAVRRRQAQCLDRVALSRDDWRALSGERGIPRFDCLILQNIDEITVRERDLLPGWTDRLIWCGDAAPAAPEPRNPAPGRNGRAAPGPRFADLCRKAEPGFWRVENGCRIIAVEPLSDAERARVEWEPLSDCPEVQIGIVPPDRTRDARLAEVRFPTDYPVARVKKILFDELQVISLHTSSPSYRIEEAAGETLVRLMEVAPEDSTVIGKGITELSAGCETVALRFEARAGWNPAAVRSWLKLHLSRPVRRLFIAVDGTLRH